MARIFWPASYDSLRTYVELGQQLHEAQMAGDPIRQEMLFDQIRSLPGFPSTGPDDELIPVPLQGERITVTVSN